MAYVYYTEDVYRITRATRVIDYVNRQELRWLGHVTRMDNDMPQKMLLFTKPRKGRRDFWIGVERETGVTKEQLWREVRVKSEFERWLDLKFQDSDPRRQPGNAP